MKPEIVYEIFQFPESLAVRKTHRRCAHDKTALLQLRAKPARQGEDVNPRHQEHGKRNEQRNDANEFLILFSVHEFCSYMISMSSLFLDSARPRRLTL